MTKQASVKANRLPKFISDFALYKKHWALFVMALPAFVYYVIFKYLPMAGVTMAFKDFKIGLGVWASPWVGLMNFESAFASQLFTRAVANTVIISLLQILVGFPMPIILALLLDEVRNIKIKKCVQTISYLPHFISWVVFAGILNRLLSPTNGPINYILTNWFGVKDAIYFLGDNAYFRSSLIVSSVWKDVGWGSILYIAAIAGISPELYEAAFCDGATRWQRCIYITIPSLIPTITIMLILRIGSIMDAGFDQVFNLYNPAVYQTGDIIDTFVYRKGIGDMKYAFSAAMGLFKNVIGFVLVVGTNYITKKLNGSGIW